MDLEKNRMKVTGLMTSFDYVTDYHTNEFSNSGSRARSNVSVIAPLPLPPTARRPVRLSKSRGTSSTTSAASRATSTAGASVVPYLDGLSGAQDMQAALAVDRLLTSSETIFPRARYTPDFDGNEDSFLGISALRKHSRQSSLSQSSDVSSVLGISPLTPEPYTPSSGFSSGVQGISASQPHFSQITTKSFIGPFEGDLSHFLDASFTLAGAGGTMAAPSEPALEAQRSKMRRFDIKISQFSLDGSPLPSSARRNRDSLVAASRGANIEEEGRDTEGGPVRSQKKSSRGRERVRIELAPDQPPTTQGKQRERVYVACLQCRSRKIRCDGARPMCHNCTHRATGRCEYDTVPKRRGPDRMPGSRQRPGRGRDGRSSEKDDGNKSDGNRKSASEDGGDTQLFTGASGKGKGRAGHPGISDGESARPEAAQQKRRRSTTASTPPSASADGGRQLPPTALPTAPISRSHQTIPAVDTDPNSDTWGSIPPPVDSGSSPSVASTLNTYHANQTFKYIEDDSTASAQLSSGKAISTITGPANEPHTYDIHQGFYDVTTNASETTLTPMTEQFRAEVIPTIPSSYIASGLPAASQDRSALLVDTFSDYSLIHQAGHLASQQFGAGELAPSLVFGQSQEGRLRSTSGATLSSSASPEASSAGLSGSTEFPSPDLNFTLPAPTASNYSSFNHPVVQSNPIIVDQHTHLGQGHIDFGGLSTEVLQQMHDRLGAGGDYIGLNESTLHSIDSLASMALQQACLENIQGVPDVSSYNPYQWAVGGGASYVEHGHGSAYIVPSDDSGGNDLVDRFAHAYNFIHSPSLDFVRKTWWDSLIDTYYAEPFCAPSVAARNREMYGLSLTLSSPFPQGTVPNAATRTEVAHLILKDVQFLIRNSNYWFAFMNVPLFFSTFCNAADRETMQPALILAILMMSNFLRSSDADMGTEGRERTLWLREKAQAALEASVNAGWIDSALAQAAWILAVFEVSAHPIRTVQRTESAFTILDSIIRTLSLTYIDEDIEDSNSSSSSLSPAVPFDPRRIHSNNEANSQHLHHAQTNQMQSRQYSGAPASAHKSQSHVYPLPLYKREPISVSHHSQPKHSSQLLQYHTSAPPVDAESAACSCAELSLGRNWPEAQEHAPLWLCTPAWNPNWTTAEVKREESRRLCWQALSITAGYSTYRAAMGAPVHDLFILQPSNFRLLFPGENLSGLPALSVPGEGERFHPVRETVWALYARAMLLWHACVRIRGQSVSDHERALFASAVWREADAIENALDGHTCQTERAFLFQGREYLFNARMYVSYEFRRFVPHPSPNMSGAIHRKKAEEWLTHQATLSKRIMMGLQTVTGLKNNVLAKRPFFIFWFMGQIKRCLQLWQLDKSLTIAIHLSKQFLPPIDYLTALWPCEDQRRFYMEIRQELEHACLEIGLDPPPPPNLRFSPAALP